MKKTPPLPNPTFFPRRFHKRAVFISTLNLPPKTKLVVVCGGVEHCAPDYAIGRKSFPFHSIEFVAQGSGRLKLNRSEYVLQPGSVFSYGPGIPHDISTSSHRPLVKYFIDFAGSDAVRLLELAQT